MGIFYSLLSTFSLFWTNLVRFVDRNGGSFEEYRGMEEKRNFLYFGGMRGGIVIVSCRRNVKMNASGRKISPRIGYFIAKLTRKRREKQTIDGYERLGEASFEPLSSPPWIAGEDERQEGGGGHDSRLFM